MIRVSMSKLLLLFILRVIKTRVLVLHFTVLMHTDIDNVSLSYQTWVLHVCSHAVWRDAMKYLFIPFFFNFQYLIPNSHNQNRRQCLCVIFIMCIFSPTIVIVNSTNFIKVMAPMSTLGLGIWRRDWNMPALQVFLGETHDSGGCDAYNQN